MKVSLDTLTKSVDSIRELALLKFKAAKAFQIARFTTKFFEEFDQFIKTRSEALKQYSSDGVNVDKEKLPQAEAELRELLAKEVELPELSILESELQNFDISTALLINLSWLITKD